MSDYKLCGGTFFILLLEARQYGVGKREQYDGAEDRMSELNVMQSLSLIINPKLPPLEGSMKNTAKGNVTNYKLCKKSGGTHFPFRDSQIIITFDNNVKTDYTNVLSLMNEFVDEYIDTSKYAKKDEYLIKALADLVKKDNSIDEKQEFYIMKDGTTKTKKEILYITEFNLAAFLLGIWHFAISITNTQGKDTADSLCPSAKGGKREYTGSLGKNDTRVITFIDNQLESNDQIVIEETTVEVIDDITDDTKDSAEPEPQVINQNMNSPFIFNFHQHGNNTTQIGHIENYYADKEKK